MPGEIESKIDEFEKKWLSRCREIEKIELSPQDARIKDYELQIDLNLLPAGLTTFDMDICKDRLENIKWKYDLALNKAQTNFQNNEAKRLKKKWSSLGGIVYWLKSIFK